MENEKIEVSGVGGWLILLILGLVVLSPFFGFLKLYGEIITMESQNPGLISSSVWRALKYSTWASFLFFSMLGMAAGVGLAVSKKISAVKRARILIWMCGPVGQFVTATLIPAIIVGRSNATDPGVVGALFASFIGTSIWYIYLSKSKRVKNTYF